MGDFRRLKVWEKSHLLTLAVYAAVAPFPKDEPYGLTSQVKRSASSIPANIAEGCGRDRDTELARFLEIAMGSASEREYHLQLAHDLGFLTPRTLRPPCKRDEGDSKHAVRRHPQTPRQPLVTHSS